MAAQSIHFIDGFKLFVIDIQMENTARYRSKPMTQRNPSHAVTAAAPGRWLVLAIVSSALLLIVVDMTVLYTALSLIHI